MSKTNNELFKKLKNEDAMKKEISLIKSLIKDVDSKKVKGLTSLIENAAFMAIKLRDLMVIMDKEGMTQEYQNGENQRGIKKSAESELYNSLVKNYTTVMSKILEQSPKGAVLIEDGFEDFINGKRKN